MAIYSKARLIVGGVTLDTQLRSLAVNEGSEAQDDTAMGDTTRSAAGGLLTWTIEGEGNQSFGTATPFDLAFGAKVGTVVACVWRHTTVATANAVTNPRYSGNGLITAYQPMGGSVGDQQISTFSIVAAGTRARAVT